MTKGILGRKIGMTQVFAENGDLIPVTVIEAAPNVVLQKKTVETDGYEAIQFGFEDKRIKLSNKPEQGHVAKANTAPKRFIREFRNLDAAAYEVGQEVKVEIFAEGDVIDVTGVTKGKGFQGVIKPWRQKGTGRARQGSIRSPQWRGGGVVFGPTPRSYAYKLPKKVRRLAIKSALSTKVLEQNLVVLDALSFDAPKTKDFKAVLAALEISKKALFVTSEVNENAILSARNIPGVTVLTAEGINVLDLLGHDKVVFTQDAVKKVEEVLG